MEETTNNVVSGQETVDNSIDYISALNEMRQNSVKREAYDKLREENKRLVNAIVSGKELEASDIPAKPDINQLRKELYGNGSELTNLEYVKKTLQLREALIEQGKPDPFLPAGEKVILENSDYEAAERVANSLKELVEYADGDNIIFTNELQRVMVDSPAIASKSRRR